MGCWECEDMRNRRFSTQFIIRYMGKTLVVPDIGPGEGLSGKAEKMEEIYNDGEVAIKLNVPFTIEKQVGDHEPEPLQRKDFRPNVYDMIGHLLEMGELDIYRIQQPRFPQTELKTPKNILNQ